MILCIQWDFTNQVLKLICLTIGLIFLNFKVIWPNEYFVKENEQSKIATDASLDHPLDPWLFSDPSIKYMWFVLNSSGVSLEAKQ